MIAYLLKVNVTIVLLYAFYKLMLSRDTFFIWKRVTLLAIIVISVISPLLNFGGWLQHQEQVKAVANVYNEVVMPELKVGLIYASSDNWEVLKTIFSVLYLVVVMLLFVRVLVQLMSVLNMAKKCEKSEIHGVHVRITDENIAPFSFFKLIFVNLELHSNELKEILSHEQAHAKQWHSIDVLVGELTCVIFWYNPFMWLLNRDIRNNLEYLADSAVVNEGYNAKEYQYHLLGLTYKKAAANLHNNFNVLTLKERIKMMNKKRTKEFGKFKYLFLLPTFATVILVGCNMNNEQGEQEDKTESIVVSQSSTGIDSTERTETVSVQITSDKTPQESINDVRKVAEKMPQFQGGQAALSKYLMENISYPADALTDKIEGMVIVQFVVKADGSIGDTKIVKGVSSSLNAEAERVVKSLPKFEPGMQEGKPVDVLFTLPISFKIPNK